MSRIKDFDLVAAHVHHPEPHRKGLFGDLYCHHVTRIYMLLVGSCWYSVPQDWAARIDALMLANDPWGA